MAWTRDRVLRVLEDHRDTIRGYGVRRLGLFGSAVRGENTETSDLDFIVEFDDLSFNNYMDLSFFLEDLFECEVDLAISEDIKPIIRPRILEEAVYVAGL